MIFGLFFDVFCIFRDISRENLAIFGFAFWSKLMFFSPENGIFALLTPDSEKKLLFSSILIWFCIFPHFSNFFVKLLNLFVVDQFWRFTMADYFPRCIHILRWFEIVAHLFRLVFILILVLVSSDFGYDGVGYVLGIVHFSFHQTIVSFYNLFMERNICLQKFVFTCVDITFLVIVSSENSRSMFLRTSSDFIPRVKYQVWFHVSILSNLSIVHPQQIPPGHNIVIWPHFDHHYGCQWISTKVFGNLICRFDQSHSVFNTIAFSSRNKK